MYNNNVVYLDVMTTTAKTRFSISFKILYKYPDLTCFYFSNVYTSALVLTPYTEDL